MMFLFFSKTIGFGMSCKLSPAGKNKESIQNVHCTRHAWRLDSLRLYQSKTLNVL